VLGHDGRDLAAALATIRAIGNPTDLNEAIADAFPGAELLIHSDFSRFAISLRQHGLLRPLTAAELSDGTLRYLLWVAALLTPRPPALMVLNEPETSLHPDLLPALARLIGRAAQGTQIIVVSHAPALISALEINPLCALLHLEKEFGETQVSGLRELDKPAWQWPAR
jgi:predicted ATPase